MYSIQKLTEEAGRLGIPDSAEELKVIFPYDLSDINECGKCNGFIAATAEKLYVISDGEITRSVMLCDISEFSVVPGVGCRCIEYTANDSKEYILCRASELYSKVFTAAVGDLVLLLKGDRSVKVREYPMGNACPVCGRP